MKSIAVLAVVFLGTVAFSAWSADPFVVGIEQTTKDAWQALATQFQASTGIPVTTQPITQSSIAQQVVLQAFTKSGKLHFVMLQTAWTSNLARYLVDLTEIDAQLRAEAIEPVVVDGRTLGVPISFANGWFLAVVAWPADRASAVQFLIAVAQGSSTTATVAPKSTGVTSLAPGKLAVSQHNPKVDGALESLFAAAQSALSSAAVTAVSALSATAKTAVDHVAKALGVPFSADTATVTVVLESRPGRTSSSNVAALSALGVKGTSVEASSSLIKVSIPISQLASLASQLTGVAFIRPPYTPYPLGTPSQGVSAIGAGAFHSAGFRGAGVKLAVIDLGFAGLSAAQSRGDLPAGAVQNDLTGTGLQSGISHGTAVAEIAYDVAPDAQLYLIKIADEVELDQAVTYCLDNGIDIINHSLGWYNTNNYDGTGTICDIARRATSGGILWVNAAGNEAQSHWEGAFVDGNGDGWHDQEVTFYASNGSPIILYMTWNEWPQSSTDYDLYLYDPSGAAAASSTKHQTGTEEPTESIQTTATQTGTYRIRFQGVGSRNLEIYSLYQGLTPYVSGSSLLAPADLAEAVAVGAVNYSAYSTGPQEPYSSQGPTNDGRTKPDLACPDNVATGTAPYTTFPGTSGAAPHAAGAAALLLSRQPTLSEPALRSQLLANTVAMGSANIYGNGRLFLQPPAPANQPPTASFTFSPASPTPGVAVSFNASASLDPDGSIAAYSWSFGDGATGAGVAPSHAYTAVGTYTVGLSVTDNQGATNSTTRSVTVAAAPNQAPIASFTYSPSSPVVGTAVSFNASASIDPDGSIASYSWSFGDGPTGSGVTTSHAYAVAGTYTISLTVTDNRGATNSTTRAVPVQVPAMPDLVATALSYAPASPVLGQSLTFTVTVQNQGNAQAGSFRVLLDSGISSTFAYISQLAAGASQSLVLSLSLASTSQTFTARADDLGQIAEANESNNTRAVTIGAVTPPPTAEAGGPYAGTAGVPISFNGSGSTGSITSYSWSFGDGTSATGAAPTHAYAGPGTYTATLTVLGPGGQSSDSSPVTVTLAQPALTASVTLAKSTYQVGESFTVSLTTNRTAYLYLCEVRADQRVLLLYPNRYQPNNLHGGGTLVLPGSGYSLWVSTPTGSETLYLFAATMPIPGFPTSFGSDFPVLSTSPDTFRNSVLATMQSLVASNDRAFTSQGFTVVAAPPAGGTLRVVTAPPGATVQLDGSSIGTTPLERTNVPTGLHTIRLSLAGYQVETRQVSIQAGATTTLTVTLTPIVPANQPPTASFSFSPASPVVGQTVTFNASASSDSDGSIASYIWDFGDGMSATGMSPTHVYAAAGGFTVTLRITDNGGLSGSTSRSVAVSSAPVTEDSAWIFPILPTTPSEGWTDVALAIDGNLSTGARHATTRSEWTRYVAFDARSGLFCDGVRFRASFPDPSVIVAPGGPGGRAAGGTSQQAYEPSLSWQVEVRTSTGWAQVYEGTPPRGQWIEARFAAQTVLQVRLRARGDGRNGLQPILLEVSFHDASS